MQKYRSTVRVNYSSKARVKVRNLVTVRGRCVRYKVVCIYDAVYTANNLI